MRSVIVPILEVVFGREDHQVRHARHRAVVLHDLADHCRRRQPGHPRQVAPGLGVAGAHQHAARLRHHRKDVARLHDVVRSCVRRHRGANGARAISRGDAGRHAFGRLDRHGEIGALAGAIGRDHQRQRELPATLFGEREADEAARVARHEVDRLRGHEFRRDNDVALVFAVLLVDEHDHAAGLEFGNDLGGGGMRHCVGKFGM